MARPGSRPLPLSSRTCGRYGVRDVSRLNPVKRSSTCGCLLASFAQVFKSQLVGPCFLRTRFQKMSLCKSLKSTGCGVPQWDRRMFGCGKVHTSLDPRKTPHLAVVLVDSILASLALPSHPRHSRPRSPPARPLRRAAPCPPGTSFTMRRRTWLCTTCAWPWSTGSASDCWVPTARGRLPLSSEASA